MLRGWECSDVLVVHFGAFAGLENLVMRTVGNGALVKRRKNSYSDSSDDSYIDSESDIQ